MFTLERAPQTLERALQTLKRALQTLQRALRTTYKRRIHKGSVYPRKNPMHESKKRIHKEGVLKGECVSGFFKCIHKGSVYPRKSPMHVSKYNCIHYHEGSVYPRKSLMDTQRGLFNDSFELYTVYMTHSS